jgi:dipeptidyl aminopeptidase/acylaminoacyl peptidase
LPETIGPDHIYDLISVTQPSVSPDGNLVAYASSRVDREEMAVHTRIMMALLPGGEARAFTHGRGDSEPRFSPDGKWLTFVRKGASGPKQLWIMPVDGGEARQLTDVSGGAGEHAWSPDSSRIVFVSDVDPSDSDEDEGDDEVKVARRIRYRVDGKGWRGDAFYQLCVVDVESGKSRQITDGEWDCANPVWSPDGDRIAFISDRGDARDRSWFAEVYVVPADGGEAVEWSQGVHSFSQGGLGGAIAWSPDGSRLVVAGTDDEDLGDPRQAWLFVVEPGQTPIRLTDGSYTPVLPAPDLRWTADGDIIFLGEHRGEGFLCRVPATGGPLTAIAGGGAEWAALSMDATATGGVCVAVTPESAGNLIHIDLATRKASALADDNADYFAEHPVVTMEKFSIHRHGVEIESRLLLPPGMQAHTKYPVVVDIHGGPHGRFRDAFDGVHQVLASAGYVVLAVNPRGSSSYGPEFAKAVLRDWGGEDYLDIMAALDELCKRDYVDTDRLGVHGYSYGGFMSAWMIGHDTRFKAAIVGAPCINLVSMYGTSDIGVSFGEPHWGGTAVDAASLVEHSPLTYAGNVETPVLLLHGEDDIRCPIGQSEEYLVALKRLDKEVEMVRFPGSSHGFVKSGPPKMREEYLTRTLAWFDGHLGAKDQGPD